MAAPTGGGPNAGVLHASDGWLYGSTSSGGAADVGVSDRMRPDGTDHQVLFHFIGGKLGRNPSTVFVQPDDGRVCGRSVQKSGAPLIFRFALPR